MVFPHLWKKHPSLKLRITEEPHFPSTEIAPNNSATIVCLEESGTASDATAAEGRTPVEAAPTMAKIEEAQSAVRANDRKYSGTTGSIREYELGSVIHRDRQGIVYRAKEKVSSDRLCVRIFNQEVADEHAAQKFLAAAERASQWCHSGVARVRNYGFAPSGKPFVATDEITGSSLSQVLKREKRLNKERTLKLFVQIVDALAYVCWTNNDVGDLSSENVFITRDAESADIIKLMDVGISIAANSDVEGLPPAGDFVAYASPERCLGHETDERSAIYSVGCMMFEALSGRAPFIGATEMEVLQNQLQEKPPALFKNNRKHLKPLESIVLKCLEKNPADRFQTFNELGAQLESALNAYNSSPPPALAPMITRESWQRCCRHFADCAIAATAISITILSVQYMVADYNRRLDHLRSSIAAAARTPDCDEDIALWKQCISDARQLHQPPDVMAQLFTEYGDALSADGKENAAFNAHKLALANFDRLGMTDDAEMSLWNIRSLFEQNVVYQPGKAMPPAVTPAVCNLYEPLLERLLKAAKENHDLAGANTVAQDLAITYFQSGRFSEAEKLLKQALHGSEDQGFLEQWQLAQCQEHQWKLAEAAGTYKLAFNQAIDTNGLIADTNQIAREYAAVLRRLGHNTEANKVLKDALKDMQRVRNPAGQAPILEGVTFGGPTPVYVNQSTNGTRNWQPLSYQDPALGDEFTQLRYP